MLLFILLPYLIAAIAYHQEIISLIYERGAFTDQSTLTTSLSFMCYSFAVFGYACQELFNRVYYALKNFHIPMRASLVCFSYEAGSEYMVCPNGQSGRYQPVYRLLSGRLCHNIICLPEKGIR